MCERALATSGSTDGSSLFSRVEEVTVTPRLGLILACAIDRAKSAVASNPLDKIAITS